MFNVGGGELLVILLIALMVLGPDRLPGFAKKAGKVLGEVRRISQGFQSEIKQAIDFHDDEDDGRTRPRPVTPPSIAEPPRLVGSTQPAEADAIDAADATADAEATGAADRPVGPVGPVARVDASDPEPASTRPDETGDQASGSSAA
jgi:sec-independent protein translocase protein TatB